MVEGTEDTRWSLRILNARRGNGSRSENTRIISCIICRHALSSNNLTKIEQCRRLRLCRESRRGAGLRQLAVPISRRQLSFCSFQLHGRIDRKFRCFPRSAEFTNCSSELYWASKTSLFLCSIHMHASRDHCIRKFDHRVVSRTTHYWYYPQERRRRSVTIYPYLENLVWVQDYLYSSRPCRHRLQRPWRSSSDRRLLP